MSNNGSAALARFTGSSHEAEVVDAKLRRAQASPVHLVAPATRCDVLPLGCTVVISTVKVDPKTETYPLPKGQLGLSKVALNKISMQLGISWQDERSRRLDDGSHPYRCHYRAVGTYRSFDGQQQVITGEKDLDLRDGSPTVEMMQARARNKGNTADDQIREMRGFILEHAETKAKNRAIRSMGLKTSYSRDELDKPFVVARLMLTGQTDDPELRRMFASMTASAMLHGQNALFGGATERPASLPAVATVQPARAAQTQPAEPRPPTTAHDPATGEVIEAKAEQAEVEPLQLPNPDRTPLPNASLRELQIWGRRTREDLELGLPPGENREEVEELAQAIEAEIAKRGEGERQREMY